MKCEYCDQDLTVSKNKPESEIDSTDVFMVQTMVCTNRRCKIYAGKDLSNPLHVAKTIRTKVG